MMFMDISKTGATFAGEGFAKILGSSEQRTTNTRWIFPIFLWLPPSPVHIPQAAQMFKYSSSLITKRRGIQNLMFMGRSKNLPKCYFKQIFGCKPKNYKHVVQLFQYLHYCLNLLGCRKQHKWSKISHSSRKVNEVKLVNGHVLPAAGHNSM